MKIERYVESVLLGLLKTKPMSQIYVSKIIDDVGICKGTFYKYYCDKYDLLQKCFFHEYYDEVLSESETFEQFVLNSLAAFRKSPKVVLHAMTAEDSNSIFGYHSKLVYEYIVKDRIAQGKPTEGEFYEYVMHFYANSVTQIFVDWLGAPKLSAPEEVMRIVRGMLPRALDD